MRYVVWAETLHECWPDNDTSSPGGFMGPETWIQNFLEIPKNPAFIANKMTMPHTRGLVKNTTLQTLQMPFLLPRRRLSDFSWTLSAQWWSWILILLCWWLNLIGILWLTGDLDQTPLRLEADINLLIREFWIFYTNMHWPPNDRSLKSLPFIHKNIKLEQWNHQWINRLSVRIECEHNFLGRFLQFFLSLFSPKLVM